MIVYNYITKSGWVSQRAVVEGQELAYTINNCFPIDKATVDLEEITNG